MSKISSKDRARFIFLGRDDILNYFGIFLCVTVSCWSGGCDAQPGKRETVTLVSNVNSELEVCLSVRTHFLLGEVNVTVSLWSRSYDARLECESSIPE